MKPTSLVNKDALRGYARMISEATGIIEEEQLREIEDIMRHDIFHSTLDWQSRSVFNKAARLAIIALNSPE